MRWLKHLTRAHLDEKMTALIDECGLEGYGFFWLLCEVIGESIEKGSNSCELSHPLKQWAKILFCHHHKVSKQFSVIAKLGLAEIYFDSTQGLPPQLPDSYPALTTPSNIRVTSGYDQGAPYSKIRVKISNLLKYRDEYASRVGTKSEENHDEVPSKIERQIQIQKQKEKTPTCVPVSLPGFDENPDGTTERTDENSPSNGNFRFPESNGPSAARGARSEPRDDPFDEWFEHEFWPMWPRRKCKTEAKKAAKRKMTSPERMSRAIDHLRVELPELLSRPPDKRPHASTWFNQDRWNDPIEQDPEPVHEHKKTRLEELLESA